MVSNRPHVPTELWPIVRRALSDLEAAVTPDTFDVSRATTTFRMAMADATAALWLPFLVRAIEKEAPGLNVRMVPLTTREPRPMLLRGDIDLGDRFFSLVSQHNWRAARIPPCRRYAMNVCIPANMSA
jgi:DNA-binding transcriptional LysR family regulator